MDQENRYCHGQPTDTLGRFITQLTHEIAGLVENGMSVEEASELVGFDMQGRKLPRPKLDKYVPTPQQIADSCLEINAHWSDAEKARRSGCNHYQWEPQTMPLSTIRLHVG